MELFHTDTYYSTLSLGVFPLHQIAHVGLSVSRDLKLLAVKLFSKNSNLYVYVVAFRGSELKMRD